VTQKRGGTNIRLRLNPRTKKKQGVLFEERVGEGGNILSRVQKVKQTPLGVRCVGRHYCVGSPGEAVIEKQKALVVLVDVMAAQTKSTLPMWGEGPGRRQLQWNSDHKVSEI